MKRFPDEAEGNPSNKAQKLLSSEEKLREALLVFKGKSANNPRELIEMLDGLSPLEDALKSFKTEDNLQKSAQDILEEVIPHTDIIPNLIEALGEESNYPFVSWYIAQSYKQGTGIKYNPSLYITYCSRAAEKGHPQAMYAMSNMFRSGYMGIIEKNEELSLTWLQAAAEENNPEALCSFGNIYLEGISGFEQDYEKALEYYQKAAEFGDSEALRKIGHFYYNGHGNIKKDYKKALEYYQKAGVLGDSTAFYVIGSLYYDGIGGVKKDHKKAFEYYEKAAELNNKESISALATCYELGHGVEKNQEKALGLYHKSSMYGNGEAGEKYREIRQKLRNSHNKKINEIEGEFKGLSPSEQLLSCLDKINKKPHLKAPKIILPDLIKKMKREDLVEVLVRMPHIGLGTGKINAYLFDVLKNYSDWELVDTPLNTHIKNENKKIIGTKPKPVKTTDGKEHLKIPRVLKEALEIQSEQRKSFAEGVQVLSQWQPEGCRQAVPSNVLAEVVSYLPKAGLPIWGDIEKEGQNSQVKVEKRNIVQTVIRQHQVLHNALKEQLSEIDNLKTFGERAYGEKAPEIKPVFVDMITVTREKTVKKVEKSHKDFMEKRKKWVDKYNGKNDTQQRDNGL